MSVNNAINALSVYNKVRDYRAFLMQSMYLLENTENEQCESDSLFMLREDLLKDIKIQYRLCLSVISQYEEFITSEVDTNNEEWVSNALELINGFTSTIYDLYFYCNTCSKEKDNLLLKYLNSVQKNGELHLSVMQFKHDTTIAMGSNSCLYRFRKAFFYRNKAEGKFNLLKGSQIALKITGTLNEDGKLAITPSSTDILNSIIQGGYVTEYGVMKENFEVKEKSITAFRNMIAGFHTSKKEVPCSIEDYEYFFRVG